VNLGRGEKKKGKESFDPTTGAHAILDNEKAKEARIEKEDGTPFPRLGGKTR